MAHGNLSHSFVLLLGLPDRRWGVSYRGKSPGNCKDCLWLQITINSQKTSLCSSLLLKNSSDLITQGLQCKKNFIYQLMCVYIHMWLRVHVYHVSTIRKPNQLLVQKSWNILKPGLCFCRLYWTALQWLIRISQSNTIFYFYQGGKKRGLNLVKHGAEQSEGMIFDEENGF